VTVGEEQDRFEVIGVNTSLTPGNSGMLTLNLKYTGNQPITNANAKLFTSDPLSSSDDGAYLGTIQPNETVSATFRASASNDALTKKYSSSVEVRYEEQDGDTRFTGSLSVGIPIQESSSGGIPLIPVALAGLGIAAIGGFVVYRRA
jgi:hypothetical protein